MIILIINSHGSVQPSAIVTWLNITWYWIQLCCDSHPTQIIIPTTKLLGGILVSLRPSVRPSVRPVSCVHSVAPTVLVGLISYSYIISSNFRRCVACNVSCKISKFEFLAIFSNLQRWLCLVLTRDLMWTTSMANHVAVGVLQNAGVLVWIHNGPHILLS